MTNRLAAGTPSHHGHAPAGDRALVFAELMPEAGSSCAAAYRRGQLAVPNGRVFHNREHDDDPDHRAFADLIAECCEAEATFTGGDAAAGTRCQDAWRPLFAARLTALRELALQLRWLIGDMEEQGSRMGPHESTDIDVLRDIAD